MAAAIVPVLALIAPLILPAITVVEGLLGKGTGAQKMTAVVDILTGTITGVANKGLIASVGTGVVDPGLPKMIQDAVQKVFDQTKIVSVPGSGSVAVPVVTGGVSQMVTLTIGKVIVTFPVSG
jgi:hypothetical protein